MRTRRAAVALLAIVLGTGLAACGTGKAKTATPSYQATQATFAPGTTMDRLNKAGKIKIGVKYDQPGLGQLNPGTNKPEGFDVEIAKIVAAALGLKPDQIEFTESVSKNRESFIQNGTVATVTAAMPLGTHCSAQMTPPLPMQIVRRPMTARRTCRDLGRSGSAATKPPTSRACWSGRPRSTTSRRATTS